MPQLSSSSYKVLFKEWCTTGLSEQIAMVDRCELQKEYQELRSRAPRRSSDYFREHDGTLSTRNKDKYFGHKTNRFEEHLAIALWRIKFWPCPNGDKLRLLDYQFPLKSRRPDDLGKVDILGITDQGQLVVIELKVNPRADNDRGDTPVKAMMQGLRYSAVIEANLAVIRREAEEHHDVKIAERTPRVQILAPLAWWCGWLGLSGSTREAAGGWETAFAKLADDVKEGLDVTVECVALDDVNHSDITYGSTDRSPQLGRIPALYPVRPGEVPPLGSALPARRLEPKP